MRYTEPFTFLFKQHHFVMTLLIGSVMFFIPIVGPIVLMGWCVQIHHTLMNGREEIPALTFDNFSELLNLGLGPFLVGLIASVFGTVILLPLMMVPSLGLGLAISLMINAGQEDLAPIVSIVFVLVFSVIAFIAAYAFTFAYKAILIRAELNPDVNQALSAFSWTYVKDFIKRTKKELFFSVVALGALSFLLMIAGMLTFMIGIYPVAVITTVASVHFRAQLYSVYLSRGGTPLPVKPLDGDVPTASPGAPLPYGSTNQ